MHAWLSPRIDRPICSLHWFSFIAQNNETVRNITKEISAVKDQGIAVFWNFVVTFAFYNSHNIVLLDSANTNSRSIASLQRELNAASSQFLKSNSLFDAYKMSYGARSTVTNRAIWRTTYNLRYLIENRNQAVLFDWDEFISVFSNSCWLNRFQALCNILCLYQERSSKLKVRRTLITNHCKILMWGRIRIAHRETRTVNNLCYSFPFLKLRKLTNMRKLNFTVS